MITLSNLVEQYVSTTPYLEEALVQGLVNTSALARQLRPLAEKRLYKPVTEGALTVAIIRYSQKLGQKTKLDQAHLVKLGNLTVRSELTEYTFVNSPTLIQKLDNKHLALAFTEGIHETTFIVPKDQSNLLETALKDEYLKSKIDNLSAITISLPLETVDQPGVYYQLLKLLAWNDINIIEIVSSFTELTIMLRKNDIDKAFSVLNQLG